jgi:hypothetical protein
MNVALILTGHMRNWPEVFPNTKEYLIDKYNPDIFIHTWENEGYYDLSDPIGYFQDSPKLDVNTIKDLYRPRNIKIDDFKKDFMESTERRETEFPINFHKPRNIISQFYKMLCGFRMLENYMLQTGKEYDLIIRMRPDLVLWQDVSFNPDKFYTIVQRNHRNLGTGDLIHAGNFHNMSIFSKILYYFNSLYKKNGVFCSHEMSKMYIEQTNLPWEELWINCTIMHTPKGLYAPKNEWENIARDRKQKVDTDLKSRV